VAVLVVQSPGFHPAKTEPGAAVAVSVITVPLLYKIEQEMLQSSPVDAITVPEPVLVLDFTTLSV
jgi:hypothetical protein